MTSELTRFGGPGVMPSCYPTSPSVSRVSLTLQKENHLENQKKEVVLLRTEAGPRVWHA